MNDELIAALRAVVKAETGVLRNELMDRFAVLNGQLEQFHIRIDNLHNEMYDLRCEWRRWSERLGRAETQIERSGEGTGQGNVVRLAAPQKDDFV